MPCCSMGANTRPVNMGKNETKVCVGKMQVTTTQLYGRWPILLNSLVDCDL